MVVAFITFILVFGVMALICTKTQRELHKLQKQVTLTDEEIAKGKELAFVKYPQNRLSRKNENP